jgi:hypothetical protein
LFTRSLARWAQPPFAKVTEPRIHQAQRVITSAPSSHDHAPVLSRNGVGTTRSAPVTHQVQDVWLLTNVPGSLWSPRNSSVPPPVHLVARLRTPFRFVGSCTVACMSNPVLGSSGGRLGEHSDLLIKDVSGGGYSDLMVVSQLPTRARRRRRISCKTLLHIELDSVAHQKITGTRQLVR